MARNFGNELLEISKVQNLSALINATSPHISRVESDKEPPANEYLIFEVIRYHPGTPTTSEVSGWLESVTETAITINDTKAQQSVFLQADGEKWGGVVVRVRKGMFSQQDIYTNPQAISLYATLKKREARSRKKQDAKIRKESQAT